MIFRPFEIVFKEFENQKEIFEVLSLYEKGREVLAPEFFQYIVRHIWAKKIGWGIDFRKNENYSLLELKDKFLEMGYIFSPFVYEKGQFSIRGDIIDFYDKISSYPVRLEFFDKTLEKIYFFDLYSKKPIAKFESVFVYPIKFKNYPQEVSTLKIFSHSGSSIKDILALAKKSKNKIFIFSKFEDSFRGLTKNSKAKIYFFPPQNFGGFSFKNLHLFTDLDFERKIKIRRFKEVKDFSVGDYVVHIDHGIAKLEGIGPKTLPLSLDEQMLGREELRTFYYHLRFRNNAYLYVPLSQKRRITKYIGVSPRLSALGGKEWAKIKNLAQKEAKKLAITLYLLYSKLKKQKINIDFAGGKEFLDILEKTFPYELTPSQRKVLKEISQIIKRKEVLDYLLCGESSSGKTEVALRVSSLFLGGGKQVIFLAPTTFLAYQHYLVAKERFRKLPIKVGILSRFQSERENLKTIADFNSSKIDFLIGTHKILFSSLNFSNLGLLIIDEEQRFGVKQKEKIRFKKNNLGVLYLSATPIPRTLSLALSGIKRIGVLQELPYEKAKIKEKIILKSDWQEIKRIIEKELESKEKEGIRGQIFFVAPFVSDLYKIFPKLKKYFKNKNIVLAHGRMDRKKLAEIYSDFSLNKIDILLSTPIVEHGIDISFSNLMILWYGERFGLSDLYQLRGRVGRRGQKSLFVIAVPKKISGSSYRRLIDFLNLVKKEKPAFEISMQDLKTRGEGELLGKRQHGIVNQVGLYLFSDLVKNNVNSLSKISRLM